MSVAERLGALEPRERRLLALMVGVLLVLLIALIPYSVSLLLSDEVERNASLREALSKIETQGGLVIQRVGERDALYARYEKPVPALAGFLDKAAGQSDLEIPELKDGAPVGRGKKYEERSTAISFRQVGLRGLVKFMERVSGGSRPISISKLTIRKRASPPDRYDVQMTVSAYHRFGSDDAVEEAP